MRRKAQKIAIYIKGIRKFYYLNIQHRREVVSLAKTKLDSNYP